MLTNYHCAVQRLLGMKMATFKLHLICRLTFENEDFEVYREVLEDDSDIESS